MVGAIRSGTAFVIGVDLNTGSIILSATLGGAAGTPSSLLTSLTAGDFLYRSAQDAANGSTHQAIEGFQTWCPASTAAPGTLFSVNRNIYPSKLAGIFYDNTVNNDTVTEALVNAASLVQANGAKAKLDLIVLHPRDMKELVNDN